MNQLTQLFEQLSTKQRIWLAVTALAIVGGIVTLSRWNQERDFKPLFTGMAAEDAGTLTAKLREAGTEYRLGDNGSTILVPSDKVAEMRLQMASVGLPKSGRIGFELFDKANFGASDFAEQVNYHRAIEGELERSVMSIHEVEQARVHVTMAKESLYSEARQPAKASVLVKLRSAAPLSAQNVAAICQLTASAVPGLSPQQVSVVDTNGNLLNRPRAAGSGDNAEAGEAALEYRKSVERDVQNKIASTLEPLLGPDHFRVGVSAEVDSTSGEQSEEIFDPQKSVMTSSQRTDDGPSVASASGIPGTPSNVPPVSSKPAASTAASNYARHTENITYQSSRLVKTTRLPQGTVKRLSLSIVVDHSVRFENAKRIVEPPTPEKLKVIHDLAAAATGLNPERGDQLVVEAFPFESTLAADTTLLAPLAAPAPAAPANQVPAWLQTLLNKKIANKVPLVAVIGGAAVLLLGAAIFFLKKRGSAKKQVAMALALEAAKNKPASAADVQRQVEGRMAEQAAEQARLEAEALLSLKIPGVVTKKTEVLTKHIASEAKADPNGLAQVVRTWMNG